jgi:hypothetical protein
MLKLKDNDGACFHTLHFKTQFNLKVFLDFIGDHIMI